MEPKSKKTDLVYVQYKFKYEDTVIFKLVAMDVFEELKDASTIEFCEIINWVQAFFFFIQKTNDILQ